MAEKHADYAIVGHRPFGILIAGHYKELNGYEIHRPTGSIDWLLMYTLSGEGEIQHSKNSITCTAGMWRFLCQGFRTIIERSRNIGNLYGYTSYPIPIGVLG